MHSIEENLLRLSIVIPVGPSDKAWQELLPCLLLFPRGAEFIFSATKPLTRFEQNLVDRIRGDGHRVLWLVGPSGRATQMNRAAGQATREYIWFLHSDSQFSWRLLQHLSWHIDRHPEDLLYANLRFQNDGPSLMALNSIGAFLRSRLLQMPFGDQGFCLRKETFLSIGEFNTSLPFGEDHDLVWRAKRAGVRLRCIGAWLATSARKYSAKGWLNTTAHHLRLTMLQGVPELLRYSRERITGTKPFDESKTKK